MGVLRWLGRKLLADLIEAKASPVFAEIGRARSRGDRNHARGFAKNAREGYKVNPVVRQCCQLKAHALTQISCRLMAGEDEVESHPILDLLRRPNHFQGAQAFWEQGLIWYEHGGGMPLHANGPDLNPVPEGAAGSRPTLVTELYTYRPDRLTILSGATGVPREYVYEGDGASQTHFAVDPMTGQSRIRIIMAGSADDGSPFTYGTPATQTAAAWIDIYNLAALANVGLLANDSAPKGIWRLQDKAAQSGMTQEQFAAYAKAIREQMSGRDKDSSPFTGQFTWEQMGFSPKEMDWSATVAVASREIARAHGVPPLVLGLPGDATYSNYTEANEAFITQTVVPMKQRIVDELNAWLVPMYDPGLQLHIDEDSIPGLEARRDSKWKRIEASPILDTNEKREALGWEARPEKEASELMVPAGLVPLSLVDLDPSEMDILSDDLEGMGYSPAFVKSFLAEHAEVKQCEHETELLVSEDGDHLYRHDGTSYERIY